MPVLNLNTGASLHYVDLNPDSKKLPIIAIHGMLGTAELHLGHVMDYLTSLGYRVIGPTMRGYGESQPKPRDFPLRFYDRDTDDVLAFIDALGIERCHIIGYSDGGEIALMCAGKQPERFASVASWGAVGYFGAAMRPVVQRMLPGSAWLKADEMALHGIESADDFARQWVNSVKQMIDSGGDVSLSLAPNITARALFMLGDKDTLNPAEFAQRFVDRTPNGHLVMFECGHPVHDQQTEAFYATLAKHLQEVDG